MSFRDILQPSWWAARRWDLRRGITISAVLHIASAVAVTVYGANRFKPPEKLDVIPIELAYASIQPEFKTPPPPPPVTKPKVDTAVRDPLKEKPPTKKVVDPPVKPPEPPKEEAKPIKKPDPEPDPEPIEEPPPKPKEDLGRQDPEVPNLTKLDRPSLEDGVPVEMELEGPPFPYAYYLKQIRARIVRTWRPPRQLAAGTRYTVRVRFRIERDGTISEWDILEPSGNPTFDRSAIQSLQKIEKFGTLPPGYPQDWLGVRLQFVHEG